MNDLIGLPGEKTLSSIGFARALVSMGHQTSGALTLGNYPSFLRNLVPQNIDGTERSDHVDMAALESMIYEPHLYF
jgi:alpha-dioxygenase